MGKLNRKHERKLKKKQKKLNHNPKQKRIHGRAAYTSPTPAVMRMPIPISTITPSQPFNLDTTEPSLDLKMTSVNTTSEVPILLANASLLDQPPSTQLLKHASHNKDRRKLDKKHKEAPEQYTDEHTVAYYRELTRLIPMQIRQARHSLTKDDQWDQWIKQQAKRQRRNLQLKQKDGDDDTNQPGELPPPDYLTDPISILDNSVAYIEYLQEQLVQGLVDAAKTKVNYRQMELDYAAQAVYWKNKLKAEEREHSRLVAVKRKASPSCLL
ncbi:hypothetical protein BC941DRAFT_435357 [Chlamydoabsidia padenii]|nr:hypothetical protein BC941DRAFT_435357 [Chlamydoabsidia padenii]